MHLGVSEGRSAVQLDGMMIDTAHVRAAYKLLGEAEAAGLVVPDHPTVDVGVDR